MQPALLKHALMGWTDSADSAILLGLRRRGWTRWILSVWRAIPVQGEAQRRHKAIQPVSSPARSVNKESQ